MKKIDLHSHYFSPGFIKYLDEYFDGKGAGVATPPFSIEGYLKFMEEMEIDYGVLSIAGPHHSAAPDDVMIEVNEEANAYGGELVKKYPEKIGLFASLPIPHVDASIQAIDRALDVHQAVGFTLPSHARGIYLGDPSLDPIFEKLNERHAIVAIHPNEPQPINPSIKKKVFTPLMEFFFDTTRAIVYMNQNRTFSKFPNIKWIVPHSGALLPVIAQRIDMGNAIFEYEEQPDDILKTMNNLYFDLAGKVLPQQLPMLLQMADENRIVYGSDTPYTIEPVVKNLTDEILTTDLITDEQKEKFMYQNAETLLGR
ncbi:amidohydrolase family protein [Staphylococcus delphini]|uniref:amidohydrolase family protein n=1 Tax=Staphylococcus delphini TaxID=53344 RepID=UPI0002F9DA78|nr:amidohydrolase family protein [Staphylococcus delphini]PCF49388.1 amidohydrolase [Staphylococcus delphini]PCF76559.1 amidohydrolase [Staphylococcus delphini]